MLHTIVYVCKVRCAHRRYAGGAVEGGGRQPVVVPLQRQHAVSHRAKESREVVRRTKDEAQETRNAILDAAEQPFSERGVSRTSLEDIAHAAGVTRGAIYWHFKDKSDLFAAMVNRVTLPMEAMVARSSDDAVADPLASLKECAVSVLKR